MADKPLGDIRLKAYNETNDRYYTKTNLTTQGVGIMYKKDFNKWSDLFFWNKWKLRNKRKREEKIKQQTDSIGNDNAAKSELKGSVCNDKQEHSHCFP